MRTRPRPRLALLSMCLGAFMAILDTSVVNLGLHRMGSELGASVSTLQWVVDLYNLVYAAFILTASALGDLHGRRRVFLAGVLVFAAGSLACALANAPAVLIAGRGLSGLGAALLLPASLAILNVTFEGLERSRAIAIWASANGLAMAVGPTAGGLLVSWLGWRSIFYLVLPFALACGLLAGAAVGESRDPAGHRADVAGQALAALSLAALAVGLIEAPRWGYAAPPTLVSLAAFAAGLAGFLVRERAAAAPMVPLELFASGSFSAALADAALMTFGIYGFLFVFPLYLQVVRGYSALGAGAALLPASLSFFLLSSLATGKLLGGVGPRPLVGSGMLSAAAGLAGCAWVASGGSRSILVAALLAIGVGLGLITGPIAHVAVASVHPSRSGIASGLVNVGRMLGATVGVALVGILFGAEGPPRDPAILAAGTRRVLTLGAAAEACGALVAFACMRRGAERGWAVRPDGTTSTPRARWCRPRGGP